MSEEEIKEKMQQQRSDYYGSKYSEHVFGAVGGKVSKLEKDTTKEEEMEEFDAKHFWKDVNENEDNYKKKQTLSKSSLTRKVIKQEVSRGRS
jgi:hypothetical protein